MANTRQSTKRAKQEKKRNSRNGLVRAGMKTVAKRAYDAFQFAKEKSTKIETLAEAYLEAIKALSKAASKGAIPKKRADRKIARLTKLAKKTQPQALNK